MEYYLKGYLSKNGVKKMNNIKEATILHPNTDFTF